VRRYVRWAAYQAAEGRASDTILPERDHDAVRVMTVHAAKGLEFPITIVSGLTTKPQGQPALSVAWPDGGWLLAERDNDEFQAYKPLDEQMGDAERRRLLYVACTRAVDHLVVSLHRKQENVDSAQGTSKSTSATVLAVGGALEHGARPLEGQVAPISQTAAEPLELPWSDHAEWDAERRRAVADASVHSATSATGLATAMAEAAAAADEGLQKDAVDLDLPPWQRGRYGTAVGRAVHAVLQDADLRTGGDIDELAAAQCAAEGIFGLEARVAALSRSALSAPIVVAAAEGAEHWRELFVVADVGGTVVEGYIDLLVRTDRGLVIVDYKTDQWKPGTDKSARIARYRHQLAAYGLVLGRLLDEAIVGGVLVRCRPDQPAEQITLDAWDDALAEVSSGTAPRTRP
jgi:ATP-dependent helicase/nuclease subunit A